MKIGLGSGLIVSILIPIVLLLFGILDVAQSAAAVLLLAGLWTVAFGVAFAKSRDRLYDVGFGVIVAVLATFDFLPLQYVIGLVLLSVIGLVATTVVTGRNKPQRP